MSSDSVSASEIAKLCIHKPDNETSFKTQLQSTEHRLHILTQFTSHIKKGTKVLELGCGQGDCTAVLAALVGEQGHVTAVDPGSLDYGGPFTLGESQKHLSDGSLGSRISWAQADPLKFLAEPSNQGGKYDIAVLVLCTWYFNSPTVLAKILSAIRKAGIPEIAIAEWSLSTSAKDPAHAVSAYAHILAVLTNASLESHRRYEIGEDPPSNVRTILSPRAIKEAAKEAGWGEVEGSEKYVVPGSDVLDGVWEVGAVTGARFVKTAETLLLQGKEKKEKELGVIMAMRDSLVKSLESVEGGVKPMDVWCAVFN